MKYIKTQSFKILKFIGFILVYLIGDFFLSFVSPHQSTSTIFFGLVIALVVALFCLAFIIWRYNKQLNKRNPFGFGTKKIDKRAIIQLCLIFALLMAMQFVWQALINAKFLSEPSNENALNQSVKQMFWPNFIDISFIGPIFEEFIFRGIFFNYFFAIEKGGLHKWCGIIVCGMVFGFMHTLNFSVNWMFYSAIGWIIAFTYLHFKDVRYSITIHMLNNLSSFL